MRSCHTMAILDSLGLPFAPSDNVSVLSIFYKAVFQSRETNQLNLINAYIIISFKAIAKSVLHFFIYPAGKKKH